MKRLLKWIVGIAGLLLGLLIVAAVAVAVFIDPNDYKEKIAATVEQQTGRELKIEGDISLSFFPWLGLELGRMELGNARNFGPEPFARIGAADAKVKILPLFSGAVEMDTIVLHGLELNLTRRADGMTNWDDLAGKGDAGKTESPASTSEPKKASASPEQALAALAIGGIDIRDAGVRWNDEMAGQKLAIRNFNLSSGAISFTQPIPLSLSGDISLSKPAVEAAIELETRVGLNLPQQQYRLDATRLAVNASGEVIPGGKASVSLSGDLAADLEKQTASAKGLIVKGMGVQLSADVSASNILAMPQASGSMKAVVNDPAGLASVVILPPELKQQALKGSAVDARFKLDLGKAQSLSLAPLKLSAMGLELEASVDGKQIIDKPSFNGQLASSEFVPRQVMENAGVALPEMADPSAMTKAKLSTRFSAGLDSAALDDLKLQLDKTTLTGNASVKQFKAPVIRYQLDVDGIDVDRYLPPPGAEEKETQKASAEKAGDGAQAALPLELLRSMDIDGTIKVGKVKVMNLHTDSIVATVRAAKGQYRVNPLTANLYQGSYSGDLRFDVRKDTPVLGMNEKLSGVQAGPLMKDFLGKDYVTGKADMAISATAQGIKPKAIRKSLNGKGSFSFDKGQVKGFNLGLEIRKLYALWKKQPSPEDESKNTDFTALKGSFKVKNGVVTTNDLSTRTPLFRVAGKGDVNLVNEKLDLLLNTKVVSSFKEAANQRFNELKGETLPLTIKGKFSDPDYDIDWGVLARKALKKEEEKVKKELQKKLPKDINLPKGLNLPKDLKF